ncbi:MAG: exodeoxyribonuclease VII large subunit, partial [Candidatus Sumerlaeia bacterium]|nr:exodeoxyribonuclease VII large subunit [Candidatus Sumerlaeia bacterium]
RGGGSLEDLWEFNDEALARAIAACPIPVVSAVGHEVDFTIADFAADHRAPTPSAGAEILTAGYTDLRERVLEDLHRLERTTRTQIRDMQQRITALLNSHSLRRPEMRLREFQQRTDLAMERLPRIITQRTERIRMRLERLGGSLEGHNPALILSKGYAIIRRDGDGRVYTEAAKLKKNMRLDIELRDGRRTAIVTDDEADDLFA